MCIIIVASKMAMCKLFKKEFKVVCNYFQNGIIPGAIIIAQEKYKLSLDIFQMFEYSSYGINFEINIDKKVNYLQIYTNPILD